MDMKKPDIVIARIGDDFFDMFDVANLVYVTDFSYLEPKDNRSIFCTVHDGTIKLPDNVRKPVEFCGTKWHKPIMSIDEAKEALRGIILQIIENALPIAPLNVISPTDPFNILLPDSIKPLMVQSISPQNISLEIEYSMIEPLVEQVMFDILFDKYIIELKPINLHTYSDKMAETLGEKGTDRIYRTKAIEGQISRGIKKSRDEFKDPFIQNQIAMLGFSPDTYRELYTLPPRESLHKEKPKYIWDFFFYNFGQGTITSRQYRRQCNTKSRDYLCEDFFNELYEHKKLVSFLLPDENTEPNKYFSKIMDYYVLESYKRIDFMIKLLPLLSKIDKTKIDKDFFLLKRFHPKVLVPYIKHGKIQFGYKVKYYKPMFMLEDRLQKKIEQDLDFQEGTYGTTLINCQIIRAKAYELFNYHYFFTSTNYDQIKKFLRESYDLESYHKSNDFWDIFQIDGWKKLDSNTQRTLRKQRQDFLLINQCLFWEYTKEEQ